MRSYNEYYYLSLSNSWKKKKIKLINHKVKVNNRKYMSRLFSVFLFFLFFQQYKMANYQFLSMEIFFYFIAITCTLLLLDLKSIFSNRECLNLLGFDVGESVHISTFTWYFIFLFSLYFYLNVVQEIHTMLFYFLLYLCNFLLHYYILYCIYYSINYNRL